MKKFISHRSLLMTVLCTVSMDSSHAQQSELNRRLSQDTFRRKQRIDLHSPMYASEEDAKAYFDYRGEWKLQLGGGVAYDSNVFQDSGNLDDSWWDYQTSLVYEWWTSEETGIVITPGLGFGGKHFDRYADELDGDQVITGVEMALTRLPLGPTIGYNVGWSFTAGYGDHVQTEHVVDLSVGKEYQVGQVGLAWKLSGGRALVDPDENSAYQAAISLESETEITDNLKLLLTASTGYRDYSENSALGRDTWTLNAGAAVKWTIYEEDDRGEKAVSLVLGTTYYHAADSLPRLDADQFTVFLALQFDWEGFRFLGLPKGKSEPSVVTTK